MSQLLPSPPRATTCAALLAALLAWPAAARAEGSAPGPSQAVLAPLRARLEAALPWEGARVRIEQVRLIGELPEGGWELRLRDPEDRSGRVQAEIVPHEGSPTRRRRRVWVQARVVVEVPVHVTARAVRAGEPVTGATRIEHRRLGRLGRGFLAEGAELEGAVARGPLAAGQVLRTSRLAQPVAVERDEPVELVVRRGAAVVRERGTALARARRGELVRVRCQTTQQILTGVARGGRVVEVP